MADEFYKILEVAKNASQEEIQKAYRNLARKHHPDMNPDDPKAREKFQKIQEAFEVVGTPEKRKIYDQYGVDPNQAAQGGGEPFTWTSGAGFHKTRGGGRETEFNINDILRMFTGGGRGDAAWSESEGPNPFGSEFGGDIFGSQTTKRERRGASSQKGPDLSLKITVPFTIAVSGGPYEVRLRRPDGTNEDIRIKIPSGIVNGKKIRLRGQGEPGTRGGKAGDILLEVTAEEHPFFQRKDNNLYVKVPITLKEAVFGATITVPTPGGEVRLKVPPGSSSGKKLRVKGCGVPGTTPGDLFVELMIVIPGEWSDNDKAAVQALETPLKTHPRSELRW